MTISAQNYPKWPKGSKMHPFHSTPLPCIPSIHSIALHCIERAMEYHDNALLSFFFPNVVCRADSDFWKHYIYGVECNGVECNGMDRWNATQWSGMQWMHFVHFGSFWHFRSFWVQIWSFLFKNVKKWILRPAGGRSIRLVKQIICFGTFLTNIFIQEISRWFRFWPRQPAPPQSWFLLFFAEHFS